MKYETLTLDWDYYMLGMLQHHKIKIISLIKQVCTEIKVLDTKKGLNIIGKAKQPLTLEELLLLRLYCFDDIFRVRNEISKSLDGQPHRINRIWLKKNDFEKPTIFEGDAENLNVALYDHFMAMIDKKRPSEVKKK
jgi:hypothetical protein